MELTITLAISIISIIIAVSNFVLSRKDKATKDVREEVKQYSKHDLIEWRLDDITKKVDRILDKLETYEKEIDEKINVAMENHIKQFHK